MIDELRTELHAQAMMIERPIDMGTLHARIDERRRRRSVAKIAISGAGAFALVGGLFVVRSEPPAAPLGALPAGPATSAAVPALHACPDVAAIAANDKSSGDPRKSRTTTDDASPMSEADFKGLVTVTAVDGSTIHFQTDGPTVRAVIPDHASIDAGTIWMNDGVPVAVTPELLVGERVGLATAPASGGERVVFVDVSVRAVPSQDPAGSEPIGKGSVIDATHSTVASKPTVDPNGTLPFGPTAKTTATLAAFTATTLTLTVTAGDTTGQTVAVDRAEISFYSSDTSSVGPCEPTALHVGEHVGLAYHLSQAGAMVPDEVILDA